MHVHRISRPIAVSQIERGSERMRGESPIGEPLFVEEVRPLVWFVNDSFCSEGRAQLTEKPHIGMGGSDLLKSGLYGTVTVVIGRSRNRMEILQ